MVSTAVARAAPWAGEGAQPRGAIAGIHENCPLRGSALGSHTFFFCIYESVREEERLFEAQTGHDIMGQ